MLSTLIQLIGKFPASLAPEDAHHKRAAVELTDRCFPKNVWFRKENYVLESNDLLDMVGLNLFLITAPKALKLSGFIS
jgi:hypothetical protein